ncbi:hypothetical protein FIE12Z_6936 [Fusarium flagelliforme]|uniref:Xylanolytic transcriptional activator regulatory domain-containing protein n=1 Tax=Fusarium flagelliforme TaxID=2675880 RepID=A0A395MLT4_9HYPO|nr:hypothetical protein FIE12Z_6936 [Fusarium flagelliforme]
MSPVASSPTTVWPLRNPQRCGRNLGDIALSKHVSIVDLEKSDATSLCMASLARTVHSMRESVRYLTAWLFGKNPVNSRAKQRASQQTGDAIVVKDRDPKPAAAAAAENSDVVNSITISEKAGSLDFLEAAEVTTPWSLGSIDIPDFNDLLRSTFSFSGEQQNLPSLFGNASAAPKDYCPEIPRAYASQCHAGLFLPNDSVSLPLDRPFRADMGLVTYSHYRFISASNMHAIPHQDVTYLEAQGCLHVPITPVLNVFMSKYFAYRHLFLPLIDEGEFWDMCSQSSQSTNKISLFVLFAMLFASCNFVPIEYLKRLGYSDVHTAQADLYRKAKLLYDFDIESGQLPLAQGALLLMNWVPNVPVTNTSPNPWKTWHSLALRHAENISAHRSVRRLWWCCIIMDRLSPLCTRFHPQITPDSSTLENYVPLGFNDFQSEIHRSRVFTPAIKRRHIDLFSKFLELILILTDVLAIAFPYESKVEISPESTATSDAQLQKCRRLLVAWYKSTTVDFPILDCQDQDRCVDSTDPSNSVILHTNLMYIYYQIFNLLSMVPSFSISNVVPEGVAIQGKEICREVDFSAVACIAIPLALQLITSRLSCLRRELALDQINLRSDIDPFSKQSRLDVLVEATDALLPHYYGVDWVKETAKHTADLAQAYNQQLAQPDREAMTDWGQILIKSPGTYLRLTWTVDMCISRGRVPQDQDFPSCLRDGCENRRESLESRDKFDACLYWDSQSSPSSDLDRLLGLTEPSVEEVCDEMMLFENAFVGEIGSVLT